MQAKRVELSAMQRLRKLTLLLREKPSDDALASLFSVIPKLCVWDARLPLLDDNLWKQSS